MTRNELRQFIIDKERGTFLMLRTIARTDEKDLRPFGYKNHGEALLSVMTRACAEIEAAIVRFEKENPHNDMFI